MYYTEDKLTVPEVSKVLNCNETYVYRAIRNDIIKALDTEPKQVEWKEIKNYVESKLPPSFHAYYKEEQVA